jgi:hypothetical protein
MQMKPVGSTKRIGVGIDIIAEDWVADRGEVQAYLVREAGQGVRRRRAPWAWLAIVS